MNEVSLKISQLHLLVFYLSFLIENTEAGKIWRQDSSIVGRYSCPCVKKLISSQVFLCSEFEQANLKSAFEFWNLEEVKTHINR